MADKAEIKLEEAWLKVAKDDDLKFLLRTILDWTGIMSPPSSSNAIDTARALGRMDAGQYLLNEMELRQPYLFPLLIKENIDDHRNNEHRADDDRDQ